MALDLSKSQKAPMLPLDFSEDLKYAMRVFCRCYGGKAMGQQALKLLSSVPLVHAALAVKEAEKMSSAQRDRAASKCMQEIAVPGWIKTIEELLSSMEREGERLAMPYKWKDMLYYTTLGTGKSEAKTYMQKPASVFNKFKAIKADFTKVWLWFDTHDKTDTPPELPSGTNTQDSLGELNEAMWLESDQYKREKARQDDADDVAVAGLSAGRANGADGEGAAGSVDPAAGAGPAALAALAVRDMNGGGAAGSGDPAAEEGPAAIAALAAAKMRREQEEKDQNDGDEMPDSWCFPYLILAAVYSPWSGQAPSEWKHLESSDGPPKGKRKSGEVTIDGANPVCSPAVMSRLNPNGDALSRREHFKAVKQEKEAERKAAADKELKDARNEALETKKKGLIAMEAANTHVESIGANLKRMVELKEQEAAAKKREDKIKAVEKKLMLQLGDAAENRAELLRLLNEC